MRKSDARIYIRGIYDVLWSPKQHDNGFCAKSNFHFQMRPSMNMEVRTFLIAAAARTYMPPFVWRIIGDSCKSVGSARDCIQIHFRSRLWSRETWTYLERISSRVRERGISPVRFHQLLWLFMEIHAHFFLSRDKYGFVVPQMLNRRICLSLSGIIAIVCNTFYIHGIIL